MWFLVSDQDHAPCNTKLVHCFHEKENDNINCVYRFRIDRCSDACNKLIPATGTVLVHNNSITNTVSSSIVIAKQQTRTLSDQELHPSK